MQARSSAQKLCGTQHYGLEASGVQQAEATCIIFIQCLSVDTERRKVDHNDRNADDYALQWQAKY